MESKILIMDEDEEFLKWVEKILALAGYNTFASSKEAFVNGNFFGIKFDTVLVKFDEFENKEYHLVDKLRQMSNRIIPIIEKKLFSRNAILKLFETLGIKKYLLKPFNPLDVIAAIEMIPEVEYPENAVETIAVEKGGG
ncbi:MAG: hypothetical protein K9L86_00950 [Candidatus Omnitrophica bacterium]|nr:hypothetical protein [Candidatus Omnitrophota bacterium]